MRGKYLLAARMVLLAYVIMLSAFGWMYWPVAWRFCAGTATLGDVFNVICTLIAMGGISASMILLIANLDGLSKIADKCKSQVQA